MQCKLRGPLPKMQNVVNNPGNLQTLLNSGGKVPIPDYINLVYHFHDNGLSKHVDLRETTLTAKRMRSFRALSFCQNWPVRPVSLQKKSNNMKEHLHDNPSSSSGGLYIILEECKFEGVLELNLPNSWSGRSVLSNGKRP